MKDKLFLLARLRNRYLLAVDGLILLLIPSLALCIRSVGLDLIGAFPSALIKYSLVLMVFKIFIFARANMYRQYWPYASAEELVVLLKALLFAAVMEFVVTYGVLFPADMLPEAFPRSIPVISSLLTTFLIGGERLAVRLIFTLGAKGNKGRRVKPVLIVGAGVAGAMMVKELQANGHLGLVAVAFVDNDPAKQGRRIHGVTVVGTLEDLPTILTKRKLFQVIVALPTAPGKVMRQILKVCNEAGIESKTIPGIFEILRESARVDQFRNIKLEDLIRRGSGKSDARHVASLVMDAKVMVTGAGGSIGSELCRQIKDFGPSDLILVGHGDNSIFDITSELQKHPKFGMTVHPVLADIRDREEMEHVFATHKPDVVIHAAGHKHISLIETNPLDAVTNTVLGTKILVDLAARYNAKRFVMVSCDNAINPTSVLGATKRIAELIVHEAAENGKRPFVIVRFGNVLESRGSVVPLFEEQIRNGGPITVSHPEIRRSFMTTPEAVQLILQAGGMGKGGEVFVLDTGEQIKVIDLARDLILLHGLEEGRDIDIKITGLLPGEKLCEELFFPTDKIEPTDLDRVFLARPGTPDVEAAVTERPSYEQPLRMDVETLIEAAQQGSEPLVHRLLKKIVQEYEPTGASASEYRPRAVPSAGGKGEERVPLIPSAHTVGRGGKTKE